MPTPSLPALKAHLESGQVVLLPTDTVAGLAVLGGNREALARLVAIKGGSPRPFTLHFSSKAQLKEYFPELPPGLARLLCRKLPGPFTFLVPRRWAKLPDSWDWQWPMVGVRIPDCPVFLELAGQVKLPLCATSANLHGESPLRGQTLLDRYKSKKGILVMPEAAKVESEKSSAVISFESGWKLLRGEIESGSFVPGLRVLVLCTGNICRSPYAEALLRRELAGAWKVEVGQLAELGWKVGSAGIFALQGGLPTPHSIEVAKQQNLDLCPHRSQPVAKALEQNWDLVLGMGPNHLVEMPRNLKSELFDLDGSPVPDPYGGTLDDYQAMAKHLQRAASARTKSWEAWPSV